MKMALFTTIIETKVNMLDEQHKYNDALNAKRLAVYAASCGDDYEKLERLTALHKRLIDFEGVDDARRRYITAAKIHCAALFPAATHHGVVARV